MKLFSRQWLLISLLLFSVFPFTSCTEEDDEQAALSAAELKTEVHNLIKNHKRQSYYSLWTHFRATDAKPNGKVNDLYNNATNYTFGADQDKGGGDPNRYNREHSFPKSWFGTKNDSYPIYTDLYHLYPADTYANSQRSNLPFGKVDNGYTTWTNNYCKMGKMTTSTFSGTVFEPNNAIKGNMARTYFYMATRYEDEDFKTWNGSAMVIKNKYPFFTGWAINLLLEWNRLDPVDDAERARNEAVAKIQGNRNPYIDDPELAEYIWGEKMGKKYNLNKIKK